MKIRLGELKRILSEKFLVEAVCTSCGDPNAYVGFNSVECPNDECKFFSRRQLDDMLAAGKRQRPLPSLPKFNDAAQTLIDVCHEPRVRQSTTTCQSQTC